MRAPFRALTLLPTSFGLVVAVGLGACGKPGPTTTAPSDGGGDPTGTADAAAPADAVAIYEDLEARIESGDVDDKTRKAALDRINAVPDDGTAAYAFARAAVTGRVAELRGVKAGKLVTQAEHWAKTSRDRDPEYRDKAAARMLGTLWVMAPPRLIEHGDSEEGLELLEGLAEAAPDIVENNLRVAEAYIHLGDPDPAEPYLCKVRSQVDDLRADDRKLFDRLVAEVGQELTCDGSDGG